MMPTILHIEDDALIANIVRAALTIIGLDVVTLENADDAVEQARKVKPDAILMDIWLKGKLDGWQATEQLKQDAELAHIPVIALTAQPRHMAHQRAAEVGCDAVLTKPVMLSEIQKMVRKYL